MSQFIHHETFVCPGQHKLESSTSLPGGNLVDGLPPVVSNSARVVLLGRFLILELCVTRIALLWSS